MSKMKDVLIGASERYAAEHGISAEKVQDLILSGEIFGDKDLDWIAGYAAGKEEKMTGIEFKYVIAPTRGKAEEWEKHLIESIRKYGKAMVAELYEMAGIKTSFHDFDYGWTNENDIVYVQTKDGFWFNLPMPEKLPGIPTSEEQKKASKVKIWLVMENDPYWPAPQLISAETSSNDAKHELYTSAMRLFKLCFVDEHYPTIEHVDKSYIVTDKEDDICRTFYIVEKEVEL